MDTILLTVTAIALLGFTATVVIVGRVVWVRLNEPPRPVVDPVDSPVTFGVVDVRLSKLESDHEKLTLAVADGIERVHRAETRISKTVLNARRKLREAGLEHEGLEAEHEEIRARDEEASEPLPTVPELMADTRTIRIPGGTLEVGAL